MNRILMADSYKASQWTQYPKGTEYVFSYLESRGSKREYKETVFFGLQYFLKRYFSTPIRIDEVMEAKDIIEAHGEPFNFDGWKRLIEKHHGYLPLEIRAVKEGSVVPTHNVLMTVVNTDPEFYWLTNYMETVLCRAGWYGTTVATQSYYLKKLIKSYLDKTADDPGAEIDFKLHDFGARGVSSEESAQIGGMAHLLSFKGTDTMTALLAMKRYYNQNEVNSFSIPATEHSTITSWGKENEADAYRNMLEVYGQEGKILAVVSDSWDIYNACENIWGEELKQQVIDSGATVVIRPDSGDPVRVLCGLEEKYYIEDGGKYYSRAPHNYESSFYISEKGTELEPNFVKGILQILDEKFGHTVNSKGYKVLNNVRVIQGDGVNPDSIERILFQMERIGYSATNIAFGMGGALLQKVDRDTLKFAFKCSAVKVNGEWRDVYKDPVTDSGKTSKKGILKLVKSPEGVVETVNSDIKDGYEDLLDLVFHDGTVWAEDTFDTIRGRVKI